MNVYLNIKMENNSSGKKKKGVSWVVDKIPQPVPDSLWSSGDMDTASGD